MLCGRQEGNASLLLERRERPALRCHGEEDAIDVLHQVVRMSALDELPLV